MIPFIDLKTQFKLLEKDIRARMDKVLEHGSFIMGPEVRQLEEELASFVGVKHCIGCASGTDALLLALMAIGVGPGDAIFTTPFTFIATAEVISLLGATPVFVDIDPRTFNIDPAKLNLAVQALKSKEKSIHPLPGDTNLSPKGIITVDLFGLPCDYERINSIAETEGLFVIEDAAQGLGGEYNGKKACSLGAIGCTSFFPAKPLGCYGDGGAVFTDNDDIAEIITSIRVHGKGKHKYDNSRIGLNARLDTLQAAILLSKLDAFPNELVARTRVASRYADLLNVLPSQGNESYSVIGTLRLSTPYVPSGLQSAWAQYSVLSENSECRDKIQGSLKEAGIPTAVYYPKPLHLQTAYQCLGYTKGDFPISEDTSQKIFSLPMHPYLQEEDQQKIVDVLKIL